MSELHLFDLVAVGFGKFRCLGGQILSSLVEDGLHGVIVPDVNRHNGGNGCNNGDGNNELGIG
jgi:hypothetical protein